MRVWDRKSPNEQASSRTHTFEEKTRGRSILCHHSLQGMRDTSACFPGRQKRAKDDTVLPSADPTELSFRPTLSQGPRAFIQDLQEGAHGATRTGSDATRSTDPVAQSASNRPPLPHLLRTHSSQGTRVPRSPSRDTARGKTGAEQGAPAAPPLAPALSLSNASALCHCTRPSRER